MKSEPPQVEFTRKGKLSIGQCSKTGHRPSNEDAHCAILGLPNDPSSAFFAVFDGHAGAAASHYCKFRKYFEFLNFLMM